MLLEQKKDRVLSSGTEQEVTDFIIDTESAGVIMQAFADSIYSNKIGSVVREIASNCVDAHKEVGTQEPFKIICNRTNTGYDLIFKDFGPGLSKERVRDIFSKYFSSTKRASNDQIGGFGIGSKSPFAYTSIFHVKTVHSNVQYTYMMSRGVKAPQISLQGTKITQERNGTEIIVPIKAEDYRDFEHEIRTQLLFFDRLLCVGIAEEMNKRKIVEGEHFIVSDAESNPEDPFPKIVVGDVPYPMPGNVQNADKKATVYLKFAVGEIPVTVSRESIDVQPGVKTKIEEKLKLAHEELENLYGQKFKKEYLEWDEFIEAHTDSNQSTKKFVYEDVPIFFESLTSNNEKWDQKLEGTDIKVSDIRYTLPGFSSIFTCTHYVDRDGKRIKNGREGKYGITSRKFPSIPDNCPAYIVKEGEYSKYRDYALADKHDRTVLLIQKQKDPFEQFFKSDIRQSNDLEAYVKQLSQKFYQKYKEKFVFYGHINPDEKERKRLKEIYGTVFTKDKIEGSFEYRKLRKRYDGDYTLDSSTISVLIENAVKQKTFVYAGTDEREKLENFLENSTKDNYDTRKILFLNRKKPMEFLPVILSKKMLQVAGQMPNAVHFKVLEQKFRKNVLQTINLDATSFVKTQLKIPKKVYGKCTATNMLYIDNKPINPEEYSHAFAMIKAFEMTHIVRNSCEHMNINAVELKPYFEQALIRTRSIFWKTYHKIKNQIKNEQPEILFRRFGI